MYEFLWSILHPLWVTAFQKNTFVIFPGDGEPRSQGSLTRSTNRARERPWKTLVTCLPESGRLQTNDLGEGQVSVRFVSTEHRQVSAAIVYLT